MWSQEQSCEMARSSGLVVGTGTMPAHGSLPAARLGIVDHDYPEYHMNMRLYVCRHIAGEPQLSVHSEGRWLGRADLYSVPWFEADMELIRKLEADLR